MISRLGTVDSLRSYNPAGATRVAPSAPRDGFQASQRENLGIYQPRPEFKAEAKPASAKAWLKTALSVGMLGTMSVGALAMAPTQAMAAETKADPGLALLLNSRMAKGEADVPIQEGLAHLKPQTASLLRTLPESAQQRYVNLEPGAKQWLNDRVHGTTSAALGLITIENRGAFIDGSAVGQNVFDIARDGIAKQVKAGTIPSTLEPKLQDLVNLLRNMSSQQRETLIRALESDVQH